MLTDSHAHLDSEDYQADLDAVIARARAAGVGRIVAVGLWRAPGSFGNALDLAARMPDLFAATIGIHPHDCARVPEEDWALSERLTADARVVGVGETGLDFHYDHSPRPVQEASFRRSIGIAVFSGMLGVTAFGIFFTPVFYSVIRWFTDRKPAAAEVAVPGSSDAVAAPLHDGNGLADGSVADREKAIQDGPPKKT